MRKGSVKRKMIWVLSFVAVLVVAIIVFLLIPYSPTKSAFQSDVQSNLELSSATYSGVFSEEEIELLPELIKNHIRISGWIGQPIPNSMRAFMPSVPLYDSSDKEPMIIDYTLYLFSNPARLAYIHTSMFGIPFEGFDSTQEGVGFMRGVIGKVFTLFNETGSEMDTGQILTWLGEAPLLPSILLSENITWETIDESHVKATLNYKGLSGTGIYTFDDNGFIQSFRTDERARTGTDGSIEFIEWSAMFDEWQKDGRDLYIPNSVRAVWHENDGDLVYFASKGFGVTYN